jgi:hypothetical protein
MDFQTAKRGNLTKQFWAQNRSDPIFYVDKNGIEMGFLAA